MAVDNDKVMEFLGRFVADLGATVAAGNVVVGHRVGLYRALAQGPAPIERHAADCRALLAAPGVERAHIVGYSYSAAAALQLPVDAPETVHHSSYEKGEAP